MRTYGEIYIKTVQDNDITDKDPMQQLPYLLLFQRTWDSVNEVHIM